jgi:hypothetical protein
MLIGLGLRSTERLARRLLDRGPRIVSDTIVYALVIYSVGCIVPTPLDHTEAPTNYAPTFVTSKVNPPFGPISFTQSDLFELNIVVDDPDVGEPGSQDDLYARLFYLDNENLVWDASQIRLTAAPVPDPTNPHLRYGTFPASRRCLFAPNKSGINYLYAVVSDRPFSNTNPSTSDAGLTDTNHWELTCM